MLHFISIYILYCLGLVVLLSNTEGSMHAYLTHAHVKTVRYSFIALVLDKTQIKEKSGY